MFYRLLYMLMMHAAVPEAACQECTYGVQLLQLGKKASTLRIQEEDEPENETTASPQLPAGLLGSDEISRAKAHWVQSGQGRSTATLPPTREWPFSCTEARKVCFVENEIVALEPGEGATASAEEPQRANESGASFWHLPDEHSLSWFAQQPTIFNLPGYFDGLKDVQRTERPIRVRPASRTMEATSIWDAPLLNVTPVVVYSDWPFNFGDTLSKQFFHGYVDWAYRHPEMYKLPLAVALPYNLLLPSFWRLLEKVGLGVESFSVLSASRDEKPLCFNKIIGCSNFGRDDSWHAPRSMDSPKAWETFRKTVVDSTCPKRQASMSEQEKRVVVGLVQRNRGRQLRNLEDLFKQCGALGTLGGKRIECRKVEFSDVLKDMCSLQDLDVIVGTHGAQLANALFMRPGTSLIEVRANSWYAVDSEDRLKDPESWPNVIARSLWLTNNTRYWWYGAEAHESFPDSRSKVPGRDSDVVVQWPTLACMLKKVMSLGSDHNAYAGNSLPMLRNAGCNKAG